MTTLSPGSIVTPESSNRRNAVRRNVITGDAHRRNSSIAVSMWEAKSASRHAR
ncbi:MULTISPECIES: hypothetical protein [Mycobacterium]|uniref:hypothetical protein n=1 Tax=Mycobacterium TaxID=1763 RepID=UPI00351D417C